MRTHSCQDMESHHLPAFSNVKELTKEIFESKCKNKGGKKKKQKQKKSPVHKTLYHHLGRYMAFAVTFYGEVLYALE